MPDKRDLIQKCLLGFSDASLKDSALNLLRCLGYESDRGVDLGGSSPNAFLKFVQANSQTGQFNQSKAIFDDWKSADLLFQLTDQELSKQRALFDDKQLSPGLLRSYVFFAIELTGDNYARGKLTDIARQINRVFPMPVMVILKHKSQKQPVISIAVINRRQNKIDAAKDVLGKVTIIRDISIKQPHRGHLDILNSIALENLEHPQRLPINSFDNLHAAWEEIFNVELLNKRFYRELANWYFWALLQVEFPAGGEKDVEKRRATSLIRLLTRLIFCWFLKEKGLIPEKLFNETDLKGVLKELKPDSCSFHQAILQNLFFGTLNQQMGVNPKTKKPWRQFAKDEGFQKNKSTYGVDNLFRYEEQFREPETAIDLFADIPFLNGGLFECLDRIDPKTKKKIYVDGFSREKKNRPQVTNDLFFADEQSGVDLSEAYGERSRRNEKVRGLIRILNSYKFTIVENTPIDQEIALDPELLGKVFENLLASYNEETKTTARKQTGSFYTPRPIVEYMVDESLKAHLSTSLVSSGMSEEKAKAGLENLFAYTEEPHPFNNKQVDSLLDAIHTCKILDPACGSGAFPMGMLHKLVYIIHKLDPDNAKWMQLQIDKASEIPDPSSRDAAIKAIEQDFADNEDDYGRKLYLIENCLYGVDIQPIAIQISKLRFFISLVCDQKTNRSKKDNHGIRPLPNLETKFVAADTLISLKKDAQLELFESAKVKRLESELQRVRHDHFAATTRQKKLALQDRDRAIRDELAEELEHNAFWDQTTAKKLADWDPYDPQASADFFEPLWMFDKSLSDGFDIVFGNPPWGAKLTSDNKQVLKSIYPEIDSSTPNSFAYFVGAALRFTKGAIAFVLPDSLLIKDYSKTRKLISPMLTEIAWYSNTGIPEHVRPFVYVEHDVCIVFLQIKHAASACRILTYRFDRTQNSLVSANRLIEKKSFVFPQHEYTFNLLVDDSSRLIMEALEKHQPLEDLAQVHEGIHTGNCREILFHDSKKNKHCKPLFYGGRAGDRICNYSSQTSGWFVDYRQELIDESKGMYASLRDERIFKLPKIYVTRTGNPIKAFFDESTYASNNFFSIQMKDYPNNTSENLKAILPLILSGLANYYIRTFAAPRLGDTYIETKITHIKRIPVSDLLLKQRAQFSRLTDLMILAVKDDADSKCEFLKDLIDACVMECYFKEHMAERDLLFLGDLSPFLASYDSSASQSKQTEFLEHLYQKLNAPTSPIRNRLLRLTADSPDLLAVIKNEGQA
ncbi:MAG: hypothetical protein KF851_17385 [Pirellulaceae bacterium]|nr:hypothetical protein [Pirellulaceae bacterium]